MSDLQDALKWWKTNRVEPFDLSHDGQHAMALIVEAARRVANLDLEAAFLMMRDQPVITDWRDDQVRRWTENIVDAALRITEDE